MDDATKAVRKLQRNHPVESVTLVCRGEDWFARAKPNINFATDMFRLEYEGRSFSIEEVSGLIDAQIYGVGKGASPAEAIAAIEPSDLAKRTHAAREHDDG